MYLALFVIEKAIKSTTCELMAFFNSKAEYNSESDDDRTQLLENMVTLLRSRSTVDHVFISPSCRASVPFADRDNNKSVAVKDTDGTMSGMVSACYALLTSFFSFYWK